MARYRGVIIIEYRKDKHSDFPDMWEGVPFEIDDAGKADICDGPYCLYDLTYSGAEDNEECFSVIGRILSYISRGADCGVVYFSYGQAKWHTETEEY